MGIPHIPVNFCLGHQSGYRVNYDNINGSRANHGFRNLKGLLSVVRLGNIEIVNIHADILGIHRIERMLRIYKACNTASFLNLCDHMQGNRSLTAGFRSVYLHNSSLGNPPKPQGNIKAQRTRRDGFYVHVGGVIPQLHNGSLSKLLLDLSKGGVQCF